MKARLAALAALAGVVTAIVVLVGGSGGGGSPAARVSTQPQASRPRHHYWLVRSGQTLSLISSRTGVSTDVIKTLNPHLDLSILQSGEKVRVRL